MALPDVPSSHSLSSSPPLETSPGAPGSLKESLLASRRQHATIKEPGPLPLSGTTASMPPYQDPNWALYQQQQQPVQASDALLPHARQRNLEIHATRSAYRSPSPGEREPRHP